ncbi:glycosyltransferase family 4 protein [Methanobacterium sp.]|uniref:glycosyltransferase family 4 protein n=1 Tax=Methanobacterium sp. TaxID=2164 RepID=UPI0031580103
MKICFVSTMFPKYKGDYYGSFVFNDARMLVKKGFEVHVVTQHNPHIPYEEIMDGIYVHRFKWVEPKEFKALIHFKGLKDKFRLITYLISLFFNLFIICRRYNLNLIHAHHAIPTGLIGVIIAKITRIPIFITTHGMDITTHGVEEGSLKNVANFEEHFFFKHLLSFSLINCDKILPVSNDLEKRIVSLGAKEKKITVLRNAADIDRFKPAQNIKIRNKYQIKKEDVLILYVGHLEDFKGLFELIHAFNNIKRENKSAKLMLIGEGSQKHKAIKEISLLSEKSVIFTGKIPPTDIHEYYQAADIFVLPSHTDAGGPPVVFIEAMACGLPVIGTNVGGIPEGIENGVNGFIVPPKNVDELAKKLEILVKNENLRKEFGSNSLKKINGNSMTLEKKAEKLIKLYKNQIKNHSE